MKMIKKNLTPASFIQNTGYSYTWKDGENILNFPFLFLGFEIKDSFVYPHINKDDSGSINLAVRSGGYACHEHIYKGWVLEPKSVEVYEKMVAINNDYFNSNTFKPDLPSIIRYSQRLQEKFGANCNKSFGDFEEAIYPIDTEHLSRLSHIDNLEDFLFLKENMHQLAKKEFFYMIRSQIDILKCKFFIFGENRD